MRWQQVRGQAARNPLLCQVWSQAEYDDTDTNDYHSKRKGHLHPVLAALISPHGASGDLELILKFNYLLRQPHFTV
jgi:hypothetical protein